MKTLSVLRVVAAMAIGAIAPVANAAESAMHCVSLKQTAGGSLEVYNGCGYTISAAWCVVDVDCKRGADIYSSTWNIGSGKSYPVSQSRGHRVEFAACKGRDVIIRGVGNNQFQCKD